MASKKEQQSTSVVDTLKLLLSIILIIAGIGAFYYFPEQSQLYRVLGLLVIVGIAVGLTLTTAKGKSLANFMMDSRTEVRKMVWPTRVETMQTTLMVVIIVLILAIFLWLVDMLLGWGVKSLLGG